VLLFSLGRVSFATQDVSEDLLEMKVRGVVLDPNSNTPVVLLEDPVGRRAFPIWIGVPEAQAIARAMKGVPTPRPMIHSLLKNILTELQVEVVRIIVSDFRSSTFYASIALRQGAKTLIIDARPSDAIALALDVKAPIFVAKKVIESVRTERVSPSLAYSATKLGMHLQNLDVDLAGFFQLANSEGVLVSFVEAGSQAERDGVRGGDAITEADGKPIKNLQDLLEIFKGKKVGQDILLQVTRDQHPLRLRLTLSSLE